MTDWASRFEEVFRVPASSVSDRVWAQVLGADYPRGLDAYSFVTLSELARIEQFLGLGEGDTLADLGCGRGGPGSWLAGLIGCDLVGVDIAAAAVAESTERADRLGLGDRARFRLGTFEETGLETGSVHAIVSIDALLFTPDKAAAFAEFARVLRPGGRLALTTWDYAEQPPNRPPQVPDHRPAAEAAGFEVLAYEETPEWRERQLAVLDLLRQNLDEYAAELGAAPEVVADGLEDMATSIGAQSRRILMLASLG